MKTIGYIKEYYSGSKFIGYVKCERDRDLMGYAGRQFHVATEKIKIGKKSIKKGQEYKTILYPIQGR
jgi:hypothetical protein